MLPVLMFYSIDMLTLDKWFKMLDNEQSTQGLEDHQQQESHDDATYIYEAQVYQQFIVNEYLQSPGIYYMRASAEVVRKLPLYFHIKKFSFTQLVHLSDIFLSNLTKFISDNKQMRELAEKGEAAKYFFQERIADITSKGLKKMREKVWNKYFGKGLMGIIRRIFSAIANFFMKYRHDLKTQIYWPGNSCHYADQVIEEINCVKRNFIFNAFEASGKVLSERLEIDYEEIRKKNISQLKKLYREKIKEIHPDKNPKVQPGLCSQLNQVWDDFILLNKLMKETEDEETSTLPFEDRSNHDDHIVNPDVILTASINDID